MAYKFADRLDLLGDRFKQLNYVEVKYYRGALVVTIEQASPVTRYGEEIVPGVSVTRIEMMDWFIDRNLINFGAGVTLPQADDKIVRQDNGEEFKVYEPGDNEPCFQYVTGSRKRLKIHTLRTKR